MLLTLGGGGGGGAQGVHCKAKNPGFCFPLRTRSQDPLVNLCEQPLSQVALNHPRGIKAFN